MKLQPRHYQTEAKTRVLREWETVPATLVVLPTGCGKTLVAAMIAEACQPHRLMMFAHREELIWQAKDKIERFVGIDCDVEMGDHWANIHDLFKAPVILSTVQTQASKWGDRRRMGRFRPDEFNRIIFDEAHHAPAKSWADLKRYYQQNPHARFLGLTATPDRADEEALGQIFDTVAYDYEILDAIHDGWLVPIEQQFVHIGSLDFSGVRTTAGDLNGADLAAVMEAEQNLHGVAGATIQMAGNRRTLVFTVSVQQAEQLAQIFNRHRPGCANWVCGKTNKDTRRQMLKDFSTNQFQFMVNCGVLTEGYDDWGVQCIAMAKHTKSRSLYAQMAGRGTRPVEGSVDPLPTPEARREAIARSVKPSCLILDFVGNSGKHKLMSTANILGGNVSDEAIASAIKIAQKRGGPVEMTELLEEEENKIREQAKQRRLAEEARRMRLTAKVKFSTKRIDPFDVWDIDPVRDRGWDKDKVLSEKQRDLLMRQGIDPDSMKYGAAKALLNEMFRRWNSNLCTLKQANVLKGFGYETKNLTMIEASRIMDQLKANGWRRPQ